MLAGLKSYETRFRKDHQHPVNRWLHYVGQPLVAAGLLLLFLYWQWGVLCILAGYTLMFSGHFFFEHNLPGILQNPGYLLIASLAAVAAIGRGLSYLWPLPHLINRRRDKDLAARTRRQFEDWQPMYDCPVVRRCFFMPTHGFLCRRLPRRHGLKVLEVACGTGRLLSMLPRYLPGVEPFGVDLAAGMLQQARHVVGPEAKLVRGDVMRLPFAAGCFDLVLCAHAFHHFPDQARAVREMYRVLRPGGLACILDGDRDDALGRFLYDVVVRCCEGPVHHASAREMRRLFAAAGFASIQQYWQDSFPPVLLTMGCTTRDGSGRLLLPDGRGS
jgi:SAM-dependent methyltransferase